MKLNPQQQEAVNHKDGPILILAGAGSGKTRVIVNRIVKLIQSDNIPPWQILAVTFTNKAANEMRERIMDMLALSEKCPVTIGTFHAICVRILRREHHCLHLNPNFTICDDSEQMARIKRVLSDMGVSPDRIKPKSIQATISRVKNDFVSPGEFRDAAGKNMYLSVAADVYERYEAGLRADHSVDFDDLITKTVQLFRNEPAVLEKYQNRYRYIMIDEYQDTNNAQYQLVLLLAQRYRNVMAVGDDDQSIYRWRGAEVTNILNFTRDFPGAKTVKLEQNYRSTQTILSAASALMMQNRNRNPKNLWTEKKGGEAIDVTFWESDREEAHGVGRIIRSMVNDRCFAWDDFAVFYRTNAQSRILEEVFQGKDIPHRVIGNISFFKRKEVKDLLAYIRLTLNPSDSSALLRVINVPRRGIGKKTIEMIASMATDRGTDLFTALENLVDDSGLTAHKQKHVTVFRDLIRDLIRFERTHSAGEFVAYCLEKTGYRAQFETDRSPEAAASLEIIEEFESTVADFSSRNQGSLADFADYLSLFSQDDDDDESPSTGKVQLLTLHNAKGLEFPVVFLTGFEDGICPLLNFSDENSTEHLEEERRLVYVGMTRAKEKLFLSVAERRFRYGRISEQQPSRFLTELPDQYLTMHNTKRNTATHHRRPDNGLPELPGVSGKKPYSIGARVRHAKWGSGTILQVAGSGAKAKIVVRFDRWGTKKLLAAFAALIPLN